MNEYMIRFTQKNKQKIFFWDRGKEKKTKKLDEKAKNSKKTKTSFLKKRI